MDRAASTADLVSPKAVPVPAGDQIEASPHVVRERTLSETVFHIRLAAEKLGRGLEWARSSVDVYGETAAEIEGLHERVCGVVDTLDVAFQEKYG